MQLWVLKGQPEAAQSAHFRLTRACHPSGTFPLTFIPYSLFSFLVAQSTKQRTTSKQRNPPLWFGLGWVILGREANFSANGPSIDRFCPFLHTIGASTTSHKGRSGLTHYLKLADVFKYSPLTTTESIVRSKPHNTLKPPSHENCGAVSGIYHRRRFARITTEVIAATAAPNLLGPRVSFRLNTRRRKSVSLPARKSSLRGGLALGLAPLGTPGRSLRMTHAAVLRNQIRFRHAQCQGSDCPLYVLLLALRLCQKSHYFGSSEPTRPAFPYYPVLPPLNGSPKAPVSLFGPSHSARGQQLTARLLPWSRTVGVWLSGLCRGEWPGGHRSRPVGRYDPLAYLKIRVLTHITVRHTSRNAGLGKNAKRES